MKAARSTRVVAYARVSSREQALSGASLEAQEASMRAYCAWRGLELVEVVTDGAVSAAKPISKRPGGERLLEHVATGRAAAVVATKLDRLFRSTTDCLATTAAWERAGVAMHLVDMGGQSVDTSTTLGRFMLTLLAAMGEMERGLTGDRTRAVLQHKRLKGERVGTTPYGWRVLDDSKVLVEDADEQAVITSILTMRDAGRSHRKIAQEMNERGVAARGDRWHPTTVRRVLQRAAPAEQAAEGP